MYVQLLSEKDQWLSPNAWHLFRFGSASQQTTVKCDITSHGLWVAQLHLDLPSIGSPTWVKIQFIRDPRGVANTTGTNTYAISPDGPKSLQLTNTWFFGFEKDIEMGVRVRHNGKVNIKSPLRQLKALSIREATQDN
jgi:hypothetical protein